CAGDQDTLALQHPGDLALVGVDGPATEQLLLSDLGDVGQAHCTLHDVHGAWDHAQVDTHRAAPLVEVAELGRGHVGDRDHQHLHAELFGEPLQVGDRATHAHTRDPQPLLGRVV